MPGEESRTYKRIEVDALVDYTGSDVLLYHKIENISLGGICIETPTLEETGTIVELVINFPDFDETVELKGEVAWIDRDHPHNMGITFLDVDEHSHSILENYLKQTSKK